MHTFEDIYHDIANLNSDFLAVIVDTHVWRQYQDILPLNRIEGKKVALWEAPQGEQCKNLDTYRSCVEFFLDKGIHRQSHIVAVGGGALSDFAGFVAATLLRGIPWSVVPTTLLAMVDASVGGKVGLNSSTAKNMIGAFHCPQKVWRNIQFLETLPLEEMISGKGEIVKYCLLDTTVLELVENKASLGKIIKACAEYKFKLTKEDFQDLGKRKILNLGHTFGHALEKIHSLSHGRAILWGMAIVFQLFGDRGNIEILQKLCRQLDIPPWSPPEFLRANVWKLVQQDKKITSTNSLSLVDIVRPGVPVVKEYDRSEVFNALEKNNHELDKIVL